MRLSLALCLVAASAFALPHTLPDPPAPPTPVYVDGGQLTVTCTNCSGGSGTSAPTIDGGILGSLGWIDGGELGATVRNFPSGFNQNNLQAQWVIVDGGVSVQNFPAQWVIIDGGTTISNSLNIGSGLVTLDGGISTALQGGTWTDRMVGNAGAAFDAPINGSAPANVVVAGVQLQNAQPSAGTNGQVAAPTAALDHVLYVRQGGPVRFSCGIESGSSSYAQCQAGPGAGLKLYVTDITMTSMTMNGGNFNLGSGSGTNCGTGTTAIFPQGATGQRFPYPAGVNDGGIGGNNLVPLSLQFETPIATADAGDALCIKCVTTNTCTGNIQGYIAP